MSIKFFGFNFGPNKEESVADLQLALEAEAVAEKAKAEKEALRLNNAIAAKKAAEKRAKSSLEGWAKASNKLAAAKAALAEEADTDFLSALQDYASTIRNSDGGVAEVFLPEHKKSTSTNKPEPKWPVALAALQDAGFSEKQAKRIIDSSKTKASVTGYVEAIVAKDPKRAAEAAVIAGVLNDPAVDYYAKNWQQYLAGAPATSAATTTPPGFTTPASGSISTPSTEGDVAGDIVDPTANDL